MIVWRLTGNGVGEGSHAVYFATKREADGYRRDYMTDSDWGNGNVIPPPQKITIRNRAELAAALNDATGYGGT